MQLKFLEDLGLEKEIIDKIIAENSTDIKTATDTLNTQNTDLTAQLNTAKDTLKSFDGVDIKELKGKIETLTTDLATKDTEYQAKISDMAFDSVLKSAISQVGGKNNKAIIPFLDLSSLKSSSNQAEDLNKALAELKTNEDYLFNSDEPFKNPVKDTGNTTLNSTGMDSLRNAMGLTTETK